MRTPARGRSSRAGSAGRPRSPSWREHVHPQVREAPGPRRRSGRRGRRRRAAARRRRGPRAARAAPRSRARRTTPSVYVRQSAVRSCGAKLVVQRRQRARRRRPRGATTSGGRTRRLEDRRDARAVRGRRDPRLEAQRRTARRRRRAPRTSRRRRAGRTSSRRRASRRTRASPRLANAIHVTSSSGASGPTAEHVHRAGDDARGRTRSPRSTRRGRRARCAEHCSCHSGVCTRSTVRASRSMQPDPRVVPGALRRLVGADGSDLAAAPSRTRRR